MAESVDQHRDRPGPPGLMIRANACAIDVPEIRLVGRHLPIGVEVAFAQHQIELLLGEIRVDQCEAHTVKGEVPCRESGNSHLFAIEITSSQTMWNHSRFLGYDITMLVIF